MNCKYTYIPLLLWIACGVGALAQEIPAPNLDVLDSIIQTSIQNHEMPGAVLLVGHDGHVIYRKAFGNRSLEPKVEAMTADTIFDLA